MSLLNKETAGESMEKEDNLGVEKEIEMENTTCERWITYLTVKYAEGLCR